MRVSVLRDVVGLAFGTMAAHTARSVLTVLGVVIGVASLMGMTALVQGLDQSLRQGIQQLGPRTIFVARFSRASLGGGFDMLRALRRPALTDADARAIERLPLIASVDRAFGMTGSVTLEPASYQGARTKPLAVVGTTENFPLVNVVTLELGRYFTLAESQRRRQVVVLGQTPYRALFADRGIDPIGKGVRIGAFQYTAVGVLKTRPSPGGFNVGQDDVLLVPEGAYRKQFGIKSASLPFGGGVDAVMPSMLIAALPHDDVSQTTAVAAVEDAVRIQHGLKPDEPDDFDLLTQDVVLKMFDEISYATFVALLIVSSVSLLVGGIGVMAVMMISVSERTPEIGLRRALGARRSEILTQFLTEAMVLTSVGGVIGVALGTAVGLAVHVATGFPLALPWWAFAIGLGFAAASGIAFGVLPAVRAAQLDPGVALRHE